MSKVNRIGYRVEARQYGNKKFPRWIVMDSGNQYWDGKNWQSDIAKAMRYINEEEAILDAITLRSNVVPRRLYTSIAIHVDASGDFTHEEIREYLRRNLQWRVKDDCGVSSLDSARFDFDVEFDGLEEEQKRG